jgi:hypothetical protein
MRTPPTPQSQRISATGTTGNDTHTLDTLKAATSAEITPSVGELLA